MVALGPARWAIRAFRFMVFRPLCCSVLWLGHVPSKGATSMAHAARLRSASWTRLRAGNNCAVCPMASVLSWLDMHVSATKDLLSWTVAGNLRQTDESTSGPTRPKKLAGIDNHQGRSDALRQ